jgi:hypothetical protein
MLTLDTPMQVGAFGAAAEALTAISRLNPPDPRALAAVGTLVVLLTPSWEELASYRAAAGLPPMDEKSYLEMLAAAQGFVLAVAGPRETQH